MIEYRLEQFSRRIFAVAFVIAVNVLIAAGTPGAVAAPASGDNWTQYGHSHMRNSASPSSPVLHPRVAWSVSCGSECAYGGVSTALLNHPVAHRPMVMFSGSSALEAFDANGSPFPGAWPQSGRGYPAIATADGRDRIFAGRAGQPFGFVGFNNKGRPLNGWPVNVTRKGWVNVSDVTLVDDREGPTIYGREQPTAGSTARGTLLHALTAAGSERAGFPVEFDRTAGLYGGPAVSSDGSNLYVGAEESLYALTAAGKTRWVHSYPYPQAHPYIDLFCIFPFPCLRAYGLAGPSVGEDGTVYDLVFDSRSGGFGASYLYEFSADGGIKPGFPVELANLPLGAPAVASDGSSYVITGTPTAGNFRLYVIDREGRVLPGWPIGLPEPSSFSIALDNRGFAYIPAGNQVLAYDRNAQPLPGWPITIPDARHLRQIALGGDGRIYVIGDRTVERSGGLWAIEGD